MGINFNMSWLQSDQAEIQHFPYNLLHIYYGIFFIYYYHIQIEVLFFIGHWYKYFILFPMLLLAASGIEIQDVIFK